MIAYISWFHTSEVLATRLGTSLLAMISLFWFARAAQQIIFFGLRSKLSIGFFLFFLVGAALYLWPLISIVSMPR